MFISRGVDHIIRLTAVEIRPEAQIRIAAAGPVSSVRFRPDGARLLANASGVRRWDVPDGECVPAVIKAPRYQRADYSRSGRYFSAAGQGGGVFEDATGKQLDPLVPSVISQDVAFSPDERLVAVAHVGGVSVWNLQSGKKAFDIDPRDTREHHVGAVAFSPDGGYLAAGTFISNSGKLDGFGTVTIWDVRTAQRVRTFPGENCGIWRLAWSPDGRHLAVAAGVHFISRGTAKVWDVTTGKLVYDLKGHTECVWGVSFSPDGRRLVTCSGSRTGRPPETNGELKLWDMDTGLELLGLTENKATVFDVAFSPDGRWLGAGYADGKIRIWDLGRQTGLASLSN